MKEKLTQFWNRLLTDLKANKAKSAALSVLFIVLLVVVGRLFKSDSTPMPAAAAPMVIPPAVSASPDNLTRPSPQTVAAPTPQVSQAAPTTPAPVPLPQAINTSRATDKAVSIDAFPRTLERDLFVTPVWNKFLPDLTMQNGRKETGLTAKKGNLWDEFRGVVSDYQKKRNEEWSRDDAQLTQFILQSTMTGPMPMAHISGRLIRVGDMLHGFSVVRIADRHVVLQKSGMTHILSMQ